MRIVCYGMAQLPITDDYYTVLKVGQSATHENIIKSYKRLALKLHPDRNIEHDTTKAFQLVRHLFEAKLNLLSILTLLVLKSSPEAWTSL